MEIDVENLQENCVKTMERNRMYIVDLNRLAVPIAY